MITAHHVLELLFQQQTRDLVLLRELRQGLLRRRDTRQRLVHLLAGG